MQISVMERSVFRSSSFASCILRQARKWCGVVPVISSKMRTKWNLLAAAMLAIRSRSRGSCRCCFMCRMTLMTDAWYISAVWIRRPGMSCCASAFNMGSPTCRVGRQRLLERCRDRRGDQSRSVAFHASDFLLSASNQLLMLSAGPVIIKLQADTVLDQSGKAHPYEDLIEGVQLRKIFAGTTNSRQTQTIAQLRDNLRSMLFEKQLAASSLPSKVIRVVHISDQIGFFETHNVPVFVVVCRHCFKRSVPWFHRQRRMPPPSVRSCPEPPSGNSQAPGRRSGAGTNRLRKRLQEPEARVKGLRPFSGIPLPSTNAMPHSPTLRSVRERSSQPWRRPFHQATHATKSAGALERLRGRKP